jgi:sarcosine oxidase
VRAAYPLWRDLEAWSGMPLLNITGIIEIGAPDSELVTGTLCASRLHGLAHEVLDAGTLMHRFPAFRVPEGMIGVFQPDGGFLRAEPAIHAQLARAREAGAQLRVHESVVAIEPRGAGVRVTTEKDTIEAGRAVIAAGAWVKSLLPRLPVPMRATRQVLGWFAPREPGLFSRDRFPVFLLQNADGIFYGFPDDGTDGVKVAKHHHADEAVDPEHYDREVCLADDLMIRTVLAAHLPAANGRRLAAKTCLYTMTPDGDFILDRLPDHEAIIVVSPCSGHGFKFAPVIGEIAADLATAGATSHDISRFAISRFA